MLKGRSEKFFDPKIKEITLITSGYIILNKKGKKINTGKLYKHTGLVELSANNQPNKFYRSKKYSRHKYGYRRLFDWEKEENLEFVLRNNTFITFLSNPTIDSINYRIPSGEIGESWIHYYFKETIQHRFFFEYFLDEVDAISIKNNTTYISILVSEDKDKKIFSLSISEVLMTLEEVNQTRNAAQRSKNLK